MCIPGREVVLVEEEEDVEVMGREVVVTYTEVLKGLGLHMNSPGYF